MNSSIPPFTSHLPQELEDQYRRLIETRNAYSKNLSHAAGRSLETLLDELRDTWEQASLNELRQSLERSSSELKATEQKLNSNGESEKQSFTEKLEADITKRSESSKLESARLSDVERQLERDVKTWKADILRRESNLKESRMTLSADTTNYNSALTKAQERSTQKQTELNELSQHYEASLKSYNERKQERSESLKKLQRLQTTSWIARERDLIVRRSSLGERKEIFLRGLRNRRDDESESLKLHDLREQIALNTLKQTRETNQMLLKKEREHLEESLKLYENNLLEQLWRELVDRAVTLPEDLRTFMLSVESLQAWQKVRTIEGELEQVSKLLDKELMKRGIDTADFFHQLDLQIHEGEKH